MAHATVRDHEFSRLLGDFVRETDGVSDTVAVSRQYGFDGLLFVMIGMRRGLLLMSSVSEGSCLGVVTDGQGDLRLIGHEMSVLCQRFGTLLTPQLVVELKNQVLR